MRLTARSSDDRQGGDPVADEFEWFVGIDWGSEAHAVCLLDATGRIRGTRPVPHTAGGIHEAVHWVREQTGAAPAGIAVGIETPRGVLVDTLIEQGFPVWAVNPKQLDRFRDRFTAAGAKDDGRDAHVLADALRTDRRAFRGVRADDPLIVQLREVTRLREDLQADEQRLTNRLREQLYRVDAAWLTISPAADEPWLWTILAEAPDPATWAALPRRRVAAALRAHRIRRVSPEAVLEVLRPPRLTVAPGVPEAVATRIAAIVPQLQLIATQRLAAERRIDRLLDQLATREAADGEPREHRDVEILQSLPGVGRMVTATMLTEATGPLADRDYPTLRAHTGVAPVTKRSGKRVFFVHMRYACKGRLRQALYHWARTSIQRDAATRTYYDGLRARGHSHARALRSVADRWLRILIAMLKTGTIYDSSRFAQPESVRA
jgi:transposase